MKIEQILYGNQLIASVIHLRSERKSHSFFTSNKETLQVGVINKRKGESVQPHIHRTPPLSKHNIDEVLFILKGRVKVSFYTKQGKFISSKILIKDDLLIHREMAHSFEVLEDCSFLEVKPGPYLYDYKEIKTVTKNSC